MIAPEQLQMLLLACTAHPVAVMNARAEIVQAHPYTSADVKSSVAMLRYMADFLEANPGAMMALNAVLIHKDGEEVRLHEVAHGDHIAQFLSLQKQIEKAVNEIAHGDVMPADTTGMTKH